MEYSASSYLSLPKNSGVYIFIGERNEILYVGKAKNLRERVSSYFRNKKILEGKTRSLVAQIKKIKFIEVRSEIESFLLEANLIKKHSPKYNSRLTDGKSYPYIRITKKDEFPKVLIARRTEDNKSQYFGPYPNSGDLYSILKMIRRIFPYQSVMNHPKKICLYNHLGLCPCPPVFKSPDDKKKYKKDIRHIIQFLSGQTKKTIRELEKERDGESKKEDFESAGEAQRKIDLIIRITSPFVNPFNYEVNPNLAEDLYEKELKSLKELLLKNGVSVSKLERIECFDISNISGNHATGSMAVFVNGQKDTSSYRRFKIKNPPKVVPNDFEMIKEILRRRFKNDWTHPDLIVIDGGKGQISSVKGVLFNLGLNIPLVGLAKRNETIITADFKEIKYSRKDPAFNLVRSIRDEAHRFAISYHRKLRQKYYFLSTT